MGSFRDTTSSRCRLHVNLGLLPSPSLLIEQHEENKTTPKTKDIFVPAISLSKFEDPMRNNNT